MEVLQIMVTALVISFVFIRFLTLSCKVGIKLESLLYGYEDNHALECWLMGCGFAVRNFFVFRSRFNPFKALSKGFALSWSDLDDMEETRRKVRGY